MPPPPRGRSRRPWPRPSAAAPAQPTPEDHAQYFGGKIQELKDAGNWNVLVLYASEWTRKQPANATAWKELAIGYSNMRQMDDALQAATKATELAPQDPAAWRMRAQVNVSLDQPEAALQAFEKAAALDDGDLTSWVQAGNLSTQLDRLPEARHAFDKVLAANPDHRGRAVRQGGARAEGEAAQGSRSDRAPDQGAWTDDVAKRPSRRWRSLRPPRKGTAVATGTPDQSRCGARALI